MRCAISGCGIRAGRQAHERLFAVYTYGGGRKIAGDGEGEGPKPTGGRGHLVFAALIYFYTMKAVGGSDDLQEAV
jgi:hypothetical protein